MAISFEEIDLAFFRDYGAAGDVEEAFSEWENWLRAHASSAPDTKYRMLLSKLGGLSVSSVRHYLHRAPERYNKLSRETRALLDRASRPLGRTPPDRSSRRGGPPPRTRRASRISLITELSVPSEYYHLEIIRSLVRSAAYHGLEVAVHEASRVNLENAVSSVLNKFRPDGVLFLRLTPNEGVVDLLRGEGRATVMIHGERHSFPPPILCHIVPDHRTVADDLTTWLLERPQLRESNHGTPQAVLVAMPDETENVHDFPDLKGQPPSIRNERKEAVLGGLRRLTEKVELEEVPDYSFRHVLRVCTKYPHADVFACLGDQIAVGIKHCMIAAKNDKQLQHRIIGFDASKLARDEGIASFSQHLDEIGRLAIERLCQFFATEADEWPPFEELRTDVRLHQTHIAAKRG